MLNLADTSCKLQIQLVKQSPIFHHYTDQSLSQMETTSSFELSNKPEVFGLMWSYVKID